MAAGCGELVGQADQIIMGWFARTTEDAMKGTLTEAERMMLSRLEATVEAGVTATLAVIDAGKALAQIRDRQLFRDVAATWEDYVETRFRMTRRRNCGPGGNGNPGSCFVRKGGEASRRPVC